MTLVTKTSDVCVCVCVAIPFILDVGFLDVPAVCSILYTLFGLMVHRLPAQKPKNLLQHYAVTFTRILTGGWFLMALAFVPRYRVYPTKPTSRINQATVALLLSGRATVEGGLRTKRSPPVGTRWM